MSGGILSLAPEFRGAKLSAGDFVSLQAFAGEKVGEPGDSWQIVCPTDLKWVESGGLTVSCAVASAQSSDGQSTKILLPALVHQPSAALSAGPLILRHLPSGKEITFDASELGVETNPQPSKEELQSVPWLLPPVAFGGWNWWLIGLFAILALAGVFYGLRKFLPRLSGRMTKKLTHQEEALRALQSLQKFARSKKVLEQEEWKKFSFELAGALRKYVNINYRIDSSDQTDRELLADLSGMPKAKNFVELLSSILATIDEVRYGKKALDATVVPGLLLEARKFVESTYESREEP